MCAPFVLQKTCAVRAVFARVVGGAGGSTSKKFAQSGHEANACSGAQSEALG